MRNPHVRAMSKGKNVFQFRLLIEVLGVHVRFQGAIMIFNIFGALPGCQKQFQLGISICQTLSNSVKGSRAHSLTSDSSTVAPQATNFLQQQLFSLTPLWGRVLWGGNKTPRLQSQGAGKCFVPVAHPTRRFDDSDIKQLPGTCKYTKHYDNYT